MELAIRPVDAAREAFDDWKGDFQKYLMPSLEFCLDALIYSSITSLIMIPIVFIFIFPMLLMGNPEEGFDPSLFMLVYIPIYLFSSLIGLIGRSILEGGMVRVVRKMQDGGNYSFFDIVKAGWKDKWKYLKIEFSCYIFQVGVILGITIVPTTVIALIMFVFIESHLLLLICLILLLFVLMMTAIALIPLMIFFIPMTFIAFTYNMNEETGGVGSTRKALNYMWGNKKDTFILGGIFYLFGIVGSMVPGVGILLISAGNIFMYQIMCKMFPKGKKASSFKSDKKFTIVRS